MKKLLTILAAISMTATASSAVVSCGSSSSKKNVFDKIDWANSAEQIITLADGTTVRVGDLLNQNKSAIDAYLLNDVNKLVANKYALDYNNTTINGDKNLGLLSANAPYALQGDDKYNAYSNEITNFSEISLATDLYRAYVSSLLTTPLDQIYWKESNGQLNPIYYENSFGLNGKYSVWFTDDKGENFKRWTTLAETDAAKDHSTDFYKDVAINNDYLPKADVLNGNNFYLVENSKLKTGYNSDLINDEASLKAAKADFLKDNGDFKIIARGISGQKALLLRFQKHIQLDSSSKTSYQNALVMEYAKNNLYKLQAAPAKQAKAYETANNKSLYIDTSSAVAKDIQNWTTSPSDVVKANYKMVWNISLPKDKAKDIEKFINNNVKKNSYISSKIKTTDYQLIDGDVKTFADNLIKAANGSADDKGGKTSLAATTAITNNSNNGSDPYFGISGYQGIIKDKKLVDNGTLEISDDAVNKIDSVAGLGILYNGVDAGDSKQYTFEDKDNPSEMNDYVIVMPLYLMDLLRDGQDASASTQNDASTSPNDLTNIASGTWIELNPQSVDAKWKSTDNFTGNGIKEINSSDIKDKTELPSETSLMAKDGKTYLFISQADINKTLKLQANEQEINVTVKDPSKDHSGYGIKGIYSNTDNSKKDAWAYNGQEVNYAIHLGIDRNSPNSYADAWKSKDFRDENVDDIANLTNESKTDLVNTLLAVSAKDDTALQEETKNSIYRNYISIDDIHYKALLDDLSKYLKEDDSTDATD